MHCVSPNDQPERDLRREWEAHTRLQARNLEYIRNCLAARAAETIASVEIGDTETVRKARAEFAALSVEVNEWMHKAADNARALAQLPREEEA